MDDNGLWKIGLWNVSSLPANLKPGVLLKEALPYSESVKILDDFPTNQINHVSLYLKMVLKYLHLSLKIVSLIYISLIMTMINWHSLTLSEMLSLPGEDLGHTIVIHRTIHLTPGSMPSYCTL